MVEQKTIVLKAFAIFIIVSSTESKYLSMDEKGGVSGQDRLCDKDTYISLEKCMYLKRNCPIPPLMCLTESKGKLSAEGISIVYHSCSMKERCKNLNLPARDIQVHGYNIIEVNYQCQAKNTFYDICSDLTTTTNESVNLISGDTVTNFEKCRCNIEGIFTLTVQDIRLKATNATECCPTVVQVDRKQYSCNDKSANYGAVFQDTVNERLQLATVLLAAKSWNMTPEMVWISVKPAGITSLTLSCKSVPRKPEVTTFSSQHTVKSAPPKSSTDAGKHESPTSLTKHPSGEIIQLNDQMVAILILVGMIVAGVTLYIRMQKLQMLAKVDKDPQTETRLITEA